MAYMLSRKILTEAQLSAIGAAAVESTFTEEVIHQMIITMSGVKEKKLSPFMGHLMLEGKLVILENLGPIYLKTKKAKTQLKIIIEAIRRANTGRISLVHGVWEVNNYLAVIATDRPPTGKAKARNMKKPGSPKVSAEKAESIAEEISDAYQMLQSFWHENFFKPMLTRARSQTKYALRRQNHESTPTHS